VTDSWATIIQFIAEAMIFHFAFTFIPALRLAKPEHRTNHSPLSNDVVKNAWSVTSAAQYVFMAWYFTQED
jgi:hypothetical protein